MKTACFAVSDQAGAAGGGKIYFLEAGLKGGGAIKVIDADGTNEETLVTGDDANEPDGIELDVANGQMYWTSMGQGGSADQSVAPDDGRIMRANLDGSEVEVVVPLGLTTTPKQLALDLTNRKVYWSDRGDVGKDSVNPKIMRANLDGSEVEVLIKDDLISPVGIALDVAGGKFYISDRYANNIKRANLDGSDVEIVVQNTSYPVDLIIDFNRRNLYWTARQDGKVFVVPVDSTDVDGDSLTPLVTGLNAPIGIALDRAKDHLYYSDTNIQTMGGAIWRANLDGSDATEIVETALPLGLFFVGQDQVTRLTASTRKPPRS